MNRTVRANYNRLKVFISSSFSKIGICVVWERYGSVADFEKSKILTIHGFNGLTYFGRRTYISKKAFKLNYRKNETLRTFLSNIIDTTNSNLVPISFIESALLKFGTFEIRKKVLLRKTNRSHTIGKSERTVVIPKGFQHFGHLLPQLIPFLVKNKNFKFSLNLIEPDDINRNFEILAYFNLKPIEEKIKFRIFGISYVAKQQDLYPTSTELQLIRNFHLKKFETSEIKFPKDKHRIYLSRKTAADGRRIFNEDEVIEVIRKFDFEVVDTSIISFAEAATLFANTEIVVGPLGSAFFHAIPMPLTSTIIELQGTKTIRWHLRKMAYDLGFRHTLIICPTLPNLDIIVDVSILNRVIQEALTGGQSKLVAN